MSSSPVFVTQPYLPPLDEFLPYLEKIWDSHILTNGGPLHAQLEQALCEYLGVEHIALVNNGTIALLIALQALEVKGEVITTPYSFVATAHSLLWNGIKPVFVDIDSRTFNMDPARIEAAITPQTSAILPVHCYGNPCDVGAIKEIADAYDLKVIYDAAHAFAVRDEGGSILRHGDLSVLSFHATKVFNTFEGGAIVCPDAETRQRINLLKNFGFVNETTVVAQGINGKMSEINAAFGLVQLKHIDHAIQRRREVDTRYRAGLEGISGIHVPPPFQHSNYSYFPILVGRGYPSSRDELYERLKAHGIFARRYFYPLISEFPMYQCMESAARSRLECSHQVASEVICLPMHAELSDIDVDRVVALLKGGEVSR